MEDSEISMDIYKICRRFWLSSLNIQYSWISMDSNQKMVWIWIRFFISTASLLIILNMNMYSLCLCAISLSLLVSASTLRIVKISAGIPKQLQQIKFSTLTINNTARVYFFSSILISLFVLTPNELDTYENYPHRLALSHRIYGIRTFPCFCVILPAFLV